MPVKFVFLILPNLHLLDLAGADQVIHEAIDFGADFEIEYCSIDNAICTSAGLNINTRTHYSKVKFAKGDFLIIPGAKVKYLCSSEFKKNTALFDWIAECYQRQVNVVSICVGTFVIGYSGLLNNIQCTTHFQITKLLQKTFPSTKVIENILFIEDKRVYSSAGIASGIDLMLYIIEQLTSDYFAHKVARELVIYNRRQGDSNQNNIFLQYRNHIHVGIHNAQDYIVENIETPTKLSDLAEIANMSERNFTRLFKQETGCTVNEYKNLIRTEKIKTLLKNPSISKKQIALEIGLKSEKQIGRIIKKSNG